jgi:hypothetical protein
MNQRIYVLMSRHVASEISPEESEELQSILKANPSFSLMLKLLERAHDTPDRPETWDKEMAGNLN